MNDTVEKEMNAPFSPPVQRAPNIHLAGEAVEQIIMHLNNSIIFAKAQDGSMRPFVDPQPIIAIISGAIQQAVGPRQQ
ncbi:MAG TPA: hypothetical protein VNZ45_17325 [Bacteroidia bacterium]|jgi:hypothetical protein|nr:hypothetical protein [Bacteroidia bacterium]